MRGNDSKLVCKALHTTEGTLRKGLEQGAFPFGTAVVTSETAGRKNYAYLLFPEKVYEYLGIRLEGAIVQLDDGG